MASRALLVSLVFAASALSAHGQNQVIVTVAGTGTPGLSGDGGPAINANIINPGALGFDAAGNLYIGQDGELSTTPSAVRKVAPNGVITTVTGSCAFNVC